MSIVPACSQRSCCSPPTGIYSWLPMTGGSVPLSGRNLRDAAAERCAAGEPVLPELRKPAARKGDGHLRVRLWRERATISASSGTREAGCGRGYDMLPARRPDGPKDPSVSQGAEEAVPLSEKMEKNGRNIAREKRTVQNTKVKNTKAKNKGNKNVINYLPDKNKNYENRTYRQASHGKEHRLRTGRQRKGGRISLR